MDVSFRFHVKRFDLAMLWCWVNSWFGVRAIAILAEGLRILHALQSVEKLGSGQYMHRKALLCYDWFRSMPAVNYKKIAICSRVTYQYKIEKKS